MVKLKNGDFKKAFKKLRSVATSLGVKIKFVNQKFFLEENMLAYFDPESLSIRVSKKIKNDLEYSLYVLAHEIGHAIDYLDMSKKEKLESDKCIRLFNEQLVIGFGFVKEMENFVTATETIACDYADILIKNILPAYRSKKLKQMRSDVLGGYQELFESFHFDDF